VTAANNEGSYIENTIRSVMAQELRPERWVIVSDNSSDDTDAIVRRYAANHNFIHLLCLTEPHPRNFGAQANAINAGIAQLVCLEFEFLGNLDADITFEPSYFKLLLQEFERDARLGIGGGCVHESGAKDLFRSRRTNRPTSVAHAVQLIRRECFKDIGGGYPALPYGGPDTYAEVTARQHAWRVASFAALPVRHHRLSSSASGIIRGCLRQGKMDYSLGIHPLFEVFKLLRRITSQPYVIGALARCAGYLQCQITREERAVPASFISFFRQEQKKALIEFFRSSLSSSFASFFRQKQKGPF
jgi:hypothetical protein